MGKIQASFFIHRCQNDIFFIFIVTGLRLATSGDGLSASQNSLRGSRKHIVSEENLFLHFWLKLDLGMESGSFVEL